MRSSIRRILTGFIFFLTTIAVSVSGYMIAGSSFLDSLFMVVITIFSVGYEETIRVDTPNLKSFTIFVIVAGCSSLLYVVGGFIQVITEGEINRALGARRMTSGIQRLKHHAIICGFGRMGQMIAKELRAEKFPFIIIDADDERCREAEALGCLVLNADATKEESLQTAHVESAHALATVLPNDASNVFITLSARNLNPDLYILARGEVPATERKLIQAGANHVVLPAAIGGMRMAHLIARPSASRLLDSLEDPMMINDDLEQLGVRLSEITIEPGSMLDGQTIGELEVVGEGAFLIVAIREESGKLLLKPQADAIVEGNNTIIIIGHGPDEPRLTLEKKPAREAVYEGDSDEKS